MSVYRPLVLMVEDNADVLRLNGKWLRGAGFNTISAKTLDETRKTLETKTPDIVVLDILLPDGNGLEFLPELKTLCKAPVLICSSRNEDQDVLRGLKAGGDDYISKPYNVEILVARVDVMWRREQENRVKMVAALSSYDSDRVIQFGSLKLDIPAGRAYLPDGIELQLAQKEFALLLIFVQNAERFIEAEYLYEKIWKSPMGGDTVALRSVIKRLKRKIAGSGFGIDWSKGEGYIFERE